MNDSNSNSGKEKIAFYEAKWRLNSDVDEILERCFSEHRDLASAIDVVFKCIKGHLHPDIIFLRTFNEDLEMTTFSFGIMKHLLEQTASDLFHVSVPTRKTVPGLEWFAIPLDMAGETVGTFGLAYHKTPLLSPEMTLEMMDTVAEELDSYFYALMENRRKQNFFLEIQNTLHSKILPNALEDAAMVLGANVPMQDLIIFYSDEDALEKNKERHIVFRENQKIFSSEFQGQRVIESAQREGIRFLVKESGNIANLFSLSANYESILLTGFDEVPIAKVIFSPIEGSGFSLSNRDLIQVFAESLRNRIMDFNRERYLLRRNFPPTVAKSLLEKTNYRRIFLSPREVNSGLLHVRLPALFPFFGEQAAPQRIFALVNEWLMDCTEIIFRRGGAIGEAYGVRISAFYGPPFFKETPEELVSAIVASAQKIRYRTKEFFCRKENKDLQGNPNFRFLESASVIAFGQAFSGTGGANNDFMVLGKTSWEAEKLIEIAEPGQIIVTSAVHDLLSKSQAGSYHFQAESMEKDSWMKIPIKYFVLDF